MKANKPTSKEGSTALTAVALQDHLVKSLGLNDVLGPRHVGLGPAARSKTNKPAKSSLALGRFGRNHSKPKKKPVAEQEYVLDPKPPSLTLAQKFGLVEAPEQLLSETEWQNVKHKSNEREDSKLPCVICKEDFGTQEQVLLSCTHVFHRACLQAFERFTGKKTCPMCRREQYQTRVIHEGSRHHRHKCATMIQSCWRGYVVRCMYRKLREANPPKDPKLRQKFFEDKLHRITERIVSSCDFDVNHFLREMDSGLAASRNVFRDFDNRFVTISDDKWEEIQLKAVERGHTDCPICLTALGLSSYMVSPASEPEVSDPKPKEKPSSKATQSKQMAKTPARLEQTARDKSKTTTQDTGVLSKNKNADASSENEPSSQNAPSRNTRCTVLLSCSHVFHGTCLEMFEELSMEAKNVCPVCRSSYQKRALNT